MADHGLVPIRDYTDAVLAERGRTDTAWRLAYAGTTGAMLFGILTAFTVYRATQAELLRLHNDLIRSGERKAADIVNTMATKAEVEPIKAFVERETGSSITTGKLITYAFASAAIAGPLGFGIANWIMG